MPFALPGERVLTKIYRSDSASRTSHGDLVKVVRNNDELRDDSLVRCRYFGQCGGCQVRARSVARLSHAVSNDRI